MEWIERASLSIQQQTHKNFECYVVKDGCRESCNLQETKKTCVECDNCNQTSKFFRNFCNNDPRFKFYILPIHLSGAGWGPRNFAILNTNHKYIAYLDDDNWFEKNHIELLYKSITSNNYDMAYTGTNVYDQNYNLVTKRLHNQAPASGQIDTSEIMHTRDIIHKYGGWRYVKKCNDWDLISRWGEDVKWIHTNEITLNFYVREGCGIHRK